jgi:hypothetical protein
MTPDVSLDEVGAAMIDPEPPNADQNAGRPGPKSRACTTSGPAMIHVVHHAGTGHGGP